VGLDSFARLRRLPTVLLVQPDHLWEEMQTSFPY
jgi:hypothetical protein